MHKKTTFLKTLACAALSSFIFCSCSDGSGKNAKLKTIAVLSYPVDEWVRAITDGVEDVFEISAIIPASGRLHTFQPAASDIAKIAKADLFIFNDGPSDVWAGDAVCKLGKPAFNVCSISSILHDNGFCESHGKKCEDSNCHRHDHHHDHRHDMCDEHFWLSLNRSSRIICELAERIAALDPGHAAEYKANAASYSKRLEELDKSFSAFISTNKCRKIVFADSFPFSIFFQEHSIQYAAAMSGCTADAEVSFSTLNNLAKAVDSGKLQYIFTLESSNKPLARTVIELTKAKNAAILTVNPLESRIGGCSYIDAMNRNIETFKKALK